MKEKFETAKRIRFFRNRFSSNPVLKQLLTKCYHAYIWQCLVQRKETFTLSFGCHYVQSFRERVSDWCEYVFNLISNPFYKFYLIHIAHMNAEGVQFYTKVDKPMHLQIHDPVPETMLNCYLEKAGFEIIEETLRPLSSTYVISQV